MLLLRSSRFLSKVTFSSQLSIQTRGFSTHSSFQEWRQLSTRSSMATSSKVHLTVEDTGILKFKPQNSETAARTSELLQENHEVDPCV